MPNKEEYKQLLNEAIEKKANENFTEDEANFIKEVEQETLEGYISWRVKAHHMITYAQSVVEKEQKEIDRTTYSALQRQSEKLRKILKDLQQEEADCKNNTGKTRRSLEEIQKDLSDASTVYNHYTKDHQQAVRGENGKFRIQFDPKKDLEPSELKEYNERVQEIKENTAVVDKWQKYIDLKSETVMPLNEDTRRFAVGEYVKAKRDYDNLGFFGKLWGRIMPSSISKNAEIYDKMKAYEEVLADKMIKPDEYVTQNDVEIQNQAEIDADREKVSELQDDLVKDEKALETGDKDKGMNKETEMVMDDVAPSVGGDGK